MLMRRPVRRVLLGSLAVALAILTGVVPQGASADGPTSPPPVGAKVLAAGQVPTWCTDADFAEGASAYASSTGVYWSEPAQLWRSAPWCYPRWGLLTGSASQVIDAGGVATMSLTWDDGRMAGYLEAGFGEVDWTYPVTGTPVDGCGINDTTCSVQIGSAGVPGDDWSWAEFYVTAPGRVFILPESYAPRCQVANPCLDTTTHAWSWVGVRPADAKPTADFTFDVSGGHVDLHATSTDPLGGVLFHEWDFGDGHTGTGTDPGHTYTRSGTYQVTLTSTNTGHQSDSVTKEVTVTGQPLTITTFATDPPHPTLADQQVKLTIGVTNDDDRPVHDVQADLTITGSNVVDLAPGTVLPTFDLPAGASGEFDLYLDVLATGEAFVDASVTGITEDGDEAPPVAARLPVEVGLGLATRMEVTSIDRTPDGGLAHVEVVVTNNSGDGVHDLAPTLFADPEDVVAVSDPSEVVDELPDGAELSIFYDVQISTTDPIDLEFVLQATRDSDGEELEADRSHLTVDAGGPYITGATTARTGSNVGYPMGEEVTITGTGLDEVTSVEFRSEDGEVSFPVAPEDTTPTELTVFAPVVTGQLAVDGDGALSWQSDIVAVAEGAGASGEDLESDTYPFLFEGPVVESVTGSSGEGTGDALGGEQLTVTGRNLGLVTRAAFRGPTAADDADATDVVASSDTQLTLRTPNLSNLLAEAEDGTLAYDSLLELTATDNGYEVGSNLAGFRFEGPVIRSAVLASTGANDGAAVGGEWVEVTGRHLDRVTGATFAAEGDPDGQPDAGIQVVDDENIRVRTPAMNAWLVQQGDLSYAVDTDLALHITDPAVLNGSDPLTSNTHPFRSEGPILDEVEPIAGPATGGTTMTVTGRHLTGVTVATFADTRRTRAVVAADLVVTSDTTATLTIPDVADSLAGRDYSDGSLIMDADLYLGYRTDVAAPLDAITSNGASYRFLGPDATKVSKAAPAGATEVQVATNDGWGSGDYAQLGDGGPVRRVARTGSLIFDAPIPHDLAEGTIIVKVEPPGGDRRAPAIDVSVGGASGGPVAPGARLTLDYTCADAGVGVEACAGPVASGAAVDTSAAGTHTVTVRAWDANGNLATVDASYTVEAAGASGGAGALARTGLPLALAAVAGVCTLGAGVLLTGLSRRRRV